MNGIDALVILVLLLFGWQGYRSGVLGRLAGLAVMLLAVAVAWFAHREAGAWLARTTGLPRPAAVAGGFMLPFLVVELVGTPFAAFFLRRLPAKIRGAWWNRALGTLPALAEGMVVAALALTVALVWPSTAIPRDAIERSFIGNRLVTVGTAIQARAQQLMSGTLRDLLTFRTVDPHTTERLALPFRTAAGKPDPSAEAQMLQLLNEERTRRGLKPLRADEKLRTAARGHSRDMLKRGYFGHNSPEGTPPFDRMTAAGARYNAAGENLALAPTVDIAHTGLMASPGHRANILQPRFRKVGIGALRAPPYGIMFTQNFSD